MTSESRFERDKAVFESADGVLYRKAKRPDTCGQVEVVELPDGRQAKVACGQVLTGFQERRAEGVHIHATCAVGHVFEGYGHGEPLSDEQIRLGGWVGVG